MVKDTAPQGDPVSLTRIAVETLELPIRGLTPLVTHNWAEKSIREMADKQAGKARRKKEPKNPQAEYEAAFYRLPDDSPGIPAAAFKAATVGAVRNFEGLTLVLAKQSIRIVGEGPDLLVRIEGEPEMWETPVRVGMGTADLRYRPRFWPWSATLRVGYNANVLTKEAIVALVDAGGLGGVGEWRPSAPKSLTGSYGTYEVEA